MKSILTVILSLFMSAISNAQTHNSHYELLDLRNREHIAILDKMFVKNRDSESIHRAILIYSMTLQKWNSSLQRSNLENQIARHIHEQGIINGLLAPASFLIQKAIEANNIETANIINSMILQLSPKIGQHTKLIYSLNSSTEIFYTLTKNELNAVDATNSNNINYGNAQELLNAALAKNIKEKFSEQAAEHECLARSNRGGLNLEISQKDTSNIQSCYNRYNFDYPTLNNKNISHENFELSDTDCEQVLSNRNNKNINMNAIALIQHKYSEMNNSCMGECLEKILYFSKATAIATATIGSAFGPNGLAIGGFIGLVGGSAIGAIDCSSSHQCGGNPIAKKEEEYALRAAAANAIKLENEALEAQERARKASIEAEKAKFESDRNKQRLPANIKKESIPELEIEKHLKEQKDSYRNTDACIGHCNTNNIVNYGSPTYVQFYRSLMKEESRTEKLNQIFARKLQTMEMTPELELQRAQIESSKEQEQLEACLKRQILNTTTSTSTFLMNTSKEKIKKNAQMIEKDFTSKSTPPGLPPKLNLTNGN